jgi:hypothetical protein
VGEVPEPTPARPNRFPDAGGYPDERERHAKPPRQIDCSAAHAERASGQKSKRARAAHRAKTDESDHDH